MKVIYPGPIWSTRVTNVAHLLRGLLLPVLVASATAAATALPAAATVRSATSQPVARSGQWWFAALHVPAALDAAPAAGKGVTVAVLSTGVDAGHPDLAGTVTTGPDLSQTGRRQGSPEWGEEGTAVASIIAGHGHGAGGADGITGVAPGAKILSVQVTLEYDDTLNSDAAVTRRLPAAIAAGIRYAVGHGAAVIALPLDPGTLGSVAGGDAAAGGSAAERAAVSYALAHDVLLVAPAGDNGSGTGTANYPAAYPGVIAVGATARNGKLAVFTSDQSYVALTAPGAGDMPVVPVSGGRSADPAAGLTVAAPGGGYQSLASTDMSAALAAGVAALIRARYPRLTVAAVTQALERGATAPPGRGTGAAAAGWGHGELNATAALDAAQGLAAAQPSPVPSVSPIVVPAVASTGPVGTSGRADPGHLLRSLVAGIAVVAAALIACLIGVIALTRRRRRARSATLVTTARPGHRGRHARRRRGATAAHMLPASAAWPGGTARRPRLAEEPPWPPALPPGRELPVALPPARALPHARVLPAVRALPAVQPEARPTDAPLAPWEQSPADFAAAPAQPELTPWPTSSTGPMYVWNPAATTGPLPAVEDDEPSARPSWP
jgi:subtilisin family serine protease